MTWKEQIDEQKRIAQEQRNQARRERVEAQAIIAEAKHENKIRWKQMQAEKRAQRFLLLKNEIDAAILEYRDDLQNLDNELYTEKHIRKAGVKESIKRIKKDKLNFFKSQLKIELKEIKKHLLFGLKQELKAHKSARRKELKTALKAQKQEIRKKFK